MKHKPYSARIEYYAVRDMVEDKLHTGYPFTHIYQELLKAGRITMSYSAFCDYARGKGKRLHSKDSGSRRKAEVQPVIAKERRKGGFQLPHYKTEEVI